MNEFRALQRACSVAWAILPASLEFILDVAARQHVPDFEAVEARRAKRHDQSESLQIRDGVAVINVTGPIFRYADFFTEISGATSVSRLARDWAVAINDQNVSAILLNIDSPGGEVAGINEFAEMVYLSRGRKPIIAYVDGMAASAAYWIASAADEIVTDATGLLGSIGVAAAMPNPDSRGNKEIQFVSSQSPRKRPNPNTEAGRDQIQQMVDDLATVLIATVARNRDTDPATVEQAFGQGAVSVGEKAVDVGLADRLGSFEAVVAELATGNYKPRGRREPARKMAAQEEEMTTIAKLRDKIYAAFASVEDDTAAAGLAVALTAESGEGDASPAEEPITEELPPPVEEEKEEEPAAAADLRRQLARAQAAEAAAGIDAFLTEQFSAGRYLPAERDALRAAMVQAACDDLALSLPEGSRLAQLQAIVTSRPAHRLTEEQIVGSETRVLRADENDQTEMSLERRNQLLHATPVGRAALSIVK